MSITLNIDDATAAQLERAARASGVSLPQLFVQLAQQRLGLVRPYSARDPLPQPPAPRAMHCLVDLTKANELADRLNDEASVEKMRGDR